MAFILKLTVGKMYSLFESDPRYYKTPYKVSFWLFKPFLILTCLIKKQTVLWLRGSFSNTCPIVFIYFYVVNRILEHVRHYNTPCMSTKCVPLAVELPQDIHILVWGFDCARVLGYLFPLVTSSCYLLNQFRVKAALLIIQSTSIRLAWKI